MESLETIQEWLSKNFDCAYTITGLRSGEVMVSVQRGKDSLSFTRPTFKEAAEALLAVK